jgi:Domain of unknown function (DUF4389)
VLVKWWLLAIPHYIVVAVFVGGGIWLGTNAADADGVWDTSWGAGGLVGLLVFIAAVVLLFTGRYPRPLYDFVLGMDRWVLRVAAYTSLMTDAYPPFRLDMGGPDPGSVPAAPIPPAPSGVPAAQPVRPAAPPATSWTAGRVVALVVGVLLLFGAAGTLVGAGTLLWADQTQREGDYLLTPDARVDTDRYAVATDSFRLDGDGLDWAVDELIGTARVEVVPSDPDVELFVGVARSADADAYLADVGYVSLDDLSARATGSGTERFDTTDHPGGAPAQPPAERDIWVASSAGSGTQSLTWRPDDGDWTVVVMRDDGTAGVSGEVRAGATVPGLGWLITGLFFVGAVLLAVGGLLVALAVRGAQVPPAGGVPAQGGPAPSEPVLTGGPPR